MVYSGIFGITTKEEKQLLKDILKDTENIILKWSIHAITNWRNEIVPPSLIHIHVDADKLLPIRFTKPDMIIKGGRHFMMYSKASEISEVLNRLLKPDSV